MKLSIATMTWARDPNEEALLRAALLELSKIGLPTFITDGGSSDDFKDYIKTFPTFTLLEPAIKGLWPQVQTSITAAYDTGADFIIYTEPDKMDFFKVGLLDFLANISINEQTGIAVAVRSDPGFESYPAFQRMCETTINNCCSEATGIPIDYTYGPFIMNRHIAPHLAALKNDIGWGWRIYTFVISNRLGYTTTHYKGEYFCPVDQRDDDASERIYRMKQLSESIEAVVLACKVKI